MVTQYVQGKFAGSNYQDAFWEYTSPALSGLADTARFSWSDEICDALEIDIEKLPRIVEPTEIIGTLTKRAADDCGLVEGIPIVAGAFDKPCDQIGSGSNAAGFIIDNVATYPAITVCVDQFKPDIKHKTLEISSSPIKGLWMLMTYITGGGLTHKWFRDTFCNVEKDIAQKTGGNAYSILDEKASKISPGSDGLMFIPHLAGRATPHDPDVRGLWVGFMWTHTREHFYRSILEGIAYEHVCSLNAVRDNYPDITFNQVTVLGGGAVSALWNQIKSDVLGLPYVLLNRDDLTTLGAAIIGGKALGIFDDLKDTARKFLKITGKTEPTSKVHEYYKKYVEIYSGLYSNLKESYSEIAKIQRV